jgi:hypothetical protein
MLEIDILDLPENRQKCAGKSVIIENSEASFMVKKDQLKKIKKKLSKTEDPDFFFQNLETNTFSTCSSTPNVEIKIYATIELHVKE